jgi:hypothetical protein
MRRPVSDVKVPKKDKALSIVKEALSIDPIVPYNDYELFCQGSFANDTHISLRSVVDINVCYMNGFYHDTFPGLTLNENRISMRNYTYLSFKDDIEKTLRQTLGDDKVVRKEKYLVVLDPDQQMEINVYPTWEFKWYSSNEDTVYVTGVVQFADDKPYLKIVNYPKHHIAQATEKHNNTAKIYKDFVRIWKNIHSKMGYQNEKISSFLIESLAYNIPDEFYLKQLIKNKVQKWGDVVMNLLTYLHENTLEYPNTWEEWLEVSGLMYIFQGREWSRKEVNEYLRYILDYMVIK